MEMCDQNQNLPRDSASTRSASQGSVASENVNTSIVNTGGNGDTVPCVKVRELALNTNLHAVPENWLQGNFGAEPWIPGARKADDNKNKMGVSMKSLARANEALDCVGHVDVMADAGTVKQLLTLPYREHNGLSLAVHRIGRTLLIDSIDVSARAARRGSHDVRRAMADRLMMRANTKSVVPVKREVIDEKMMMSKFLYHSLDRTPADDPVTAVVKYVLDNEEFVRATTDDARILPDPLDCDLQQQPSNNPPTVDVNNETTATVRNVFWSFEDSRMMIETDLPIFGCGQHPCVSLKLRDMRKPITVLTGLDYWLDQLMCNVPEVLMCYHLNGIVQKYELLKTEDLPNVTESPFDPEMVRDVASNILSFLKSNATKEGHTYWLFKGENDDVVKLYDLSSVCSDLIEDDIDANPYTLPVGILMYRVAHNLMQHAKCVRRVANTIYRLLNNCLELLPASKYPQVIGSVHYLLANLYLSYAMESTNAADNAATDTTASTDADDDVYAADFETESWSSTLATRSQTKGTGAAAAGTASITLQALCDPTNSDAPDVNTNGGGGMQSPKPTSSRRLPNCTNVDDCCKQALENIYEGLAYTDVAFPKQTPANQQADPNSDQPISTVNPSEAIPLRYEGTQECRSLIPYAVRRPQISTWQTQLFALLLSRAATVYRLLADCASTLDHHGRALRHSRSGIVCLASVIAVYDSIRQPSLALRKSRDLCQSLLISFLCKCGDEYLNLSSRRASDRGRHEFELSSASARMQFRDRMIVDVANKQLLTVEARLDQEYAWATSSIPMTSFDNRALAIRCYTSALQLQQQSDSRSETGGARTKTRPQGTTDQSPSRAFGSVFQSLRPTRDALNQRLGSAYNEAGKFYTTLLNDLVVLGKMDESETKQVPALPSDATSQLLWLRDAALEQYSQAIIYLRAGNDVSNEALVHSNCGRVLRLHAHAIGQSCAAEEGSAIEITKKEQDLMHKAIEHYQRGLECINVQPSASSETWHCVTSNLAGVYYTFALQMQERPPLTRQHVEEVERTIADFMQRSLRLYESIVKRTDATDRVRDEAHARMFEIHYRLASMYHQTHRTLMASTSTGNFNTRRARTIRTLTDLHYTKAADIYTTWSQVVNTHRNAQHALAAARMAMQHVAFFENLGDVSVSPSTSAQRHNNLMALRLMLTTCAHAFETFWTDGARSDDRAVQQLTDLDDSQQQEYKKLSELYISRLQYVIQTLLKSTIQSSKTQSTVGSAVGLNDPSLWKSVYAMSLKLKPSDSVTLSSIRDVLKPMYEMHLKQYIETL